MPHDGMQENSLGSTKYFAHRPQPCYMSGMKAVQKVINKLGASDAEAARALKLTAPAIAYWRQQGRIPAKHQAKIRAAAPNITRRELVAAIMGE